jgi:hypothetical protein
MVVNLGANNKHINADGTLNTAAFIAANPEGWTVTKATAKLPEVVAALATTGTTAYVVGQASGTITDEEEHRVNIIGVPGPDGTISYVATSSGDIENARSYSLDTKNYYFNFINLIDLHMRFPIHKFQHLMMPIRAY